MTMEPVVPRRTLVVPAAGSGSRLGARGPKFLAEANGRPLIEWVVAVHAPHVSDVVLIVSPQWVESAVAHARNWALPTTVVVQETATGMLDAILRALPGVDAGASERVWITWCDQIAIHPATAAVLASPQEERAALTFPTVVSSPPYIHFDRDEHGAIVRVRQRREGDEMPSAGEGDAGLFSLSRHAFLRDLPAFASGASSGAGTGERNFLPFIPWLARHAHVSTFPCVDALEAVGVNTADDLRRLEAYLKGRRP